MGCQDTSCTLLLEKYKDPGDVTGQPLGGADALTTHEYEALFEQACSDAEKHGRPAKNSKCDEDCECKPVGKPSFEQDEDGHDAFVRRTVEFVVTMPGGDKHSVKAAVSVCLGSQPGRCDRPGDMKVETHAK
jgi:hypothetical protein